MLLEALPWTFLCFYYMSEQISASVHVPILQGKKVLELGCGHGIPGILALLAGAEVHFQVRALSIGPISCQAFTHLWPNQECLFEKLETYYAL
eukprot:1033304-Pelagomonas_calceolata.AAC.2